ncbi:T9SS type A sorting domain-containing protein [Mariniflexile gromovii]|uniref:T9SS type A sorting domain-containing protein n=1 Tax=Mariniflexile gromovii TaxID=362523 RepID=A0ABS4BUZ3_9FLAO|nr:T9SS type A sorting domain-containing protein [Mariniflexile gromovii]MBP0904411.1 T9SS type A sorting domain-containing protein [Mariniflexile gromovii]
MKSKLIGCVLLFISFIVNSQNTITDIEYFFDTDPGIGNATVVDVSNSANLNETVSMPINSLPSGIHILHMRTKNNLNKWSFYARQTFYIANFSSVLDNTVTAVEYFFDTDPGIGNAEPLSISNGTSLNNTFAIPLNSVSSGIHLLHIRTKNNANQWSLYARQTFYIANFSSVLNNTITEAEYFFDTDPGVGNAEPLSISNGISLNNTFTIPLNSVSTGIHILHIRVKNNFNQWSLYGRQVFYKSAQISNNTIVAAEFFIDTDPGVGNATAIALTEGATVDETLNIPIPNNLSEGDHILHIRVQNSNGTWSLYGKPEFSTTLSNEETAFKDFKIYPNPVENILHLSIQNNTIEHIQLVDMSGRVILETSKNMEQLNLSKLPTGLYLLQIKTHGGSISKKIIKK